jgi:hypothetical protein
MKAICRSLNLNFRIEIVGGNPLSMVKRLLILIPYRLQRAHHRTLVLTVSHRQLCWRRENRGSGGHGGRELRQTAWLVTEIAIALAKKQDPPADTLRLLEKAAAAIDTIKEEVHPSALEVAEKALDRLERDQPAQYEKLLSERQRDGRR